METRERTYGDAGQRRRRKWIVASVALGLFIARHIMVQEHDLDQYIERVLAEQGVPGMSIAVLRGGEILLPKGYGFASLEPRAPATAQSLYGLGSISKQFAATAVMMLVQDGDVSLDSPINRYVPNLPDSWSEITVRHLLTHTSGIKEEVWEGGVFEFDRHEHVQFEVLRTAFGPLDSAPGERWAYSNVGYRLLGMLIEEVSGESVWDFFDCRIFQPIGMNATRSLRISVPGGSVCLFVAARFDCGFRGNKEIQEKIEVEWLCVRRFSDLDSKPLPRPGVSPAAARAGACFSSSFLTRV